MRIRHVIIKVDDQQKALSFYTNARVARSHASRKATRGSTRLALRAGR
jgi:catechol 2,3-dioxygenase-like lactoylglutathione lyase family enzyme